jgi:hypothetical protein
MIRPRKFRYDKIDFAKRVLLEMEKTQKLLKKGGKRKGRVVKGSAGRRCHLSNCVATLRQIDRGARSLFAPTVLARRRAELRAGSGRDSYPSCCSGVVVRAPKKPICRRGSSSAFFAFNAMKLVCSTEDMISNSSPLEFFPQRYMKSESGSA